MCDFCHLLGQDYLRRKVFIGRPEKLTIQAHMQQAFHGYFMLGVSLNFFKHTPNFLGTGIKHYIQVMRTQSFAS